MTDNQAQRRAEIRVAIGRHASGEPLRQDEIRCVLEQLIGTEIDQRGVDRLSEMLSDTLEIEQPHHPYRKDTLVSINDALHSVDTRNERGTDR